MTSATDRIIIDSLFDLNNIEVEYICKFVDNYHKCVSKNQPYIEHLVRRIELMEYILHDFETGKYNIIVNALSWECAPGDGDYRGVTYWNQNINPTEPDFTELFYDVKDIMFGEYRHDEFQILGQDVSTSEQQKKENRIIEMKQYFRNFADLRLFEGE